VSKPSGKEEGNGFSAKWHKFRLKLMGFAEEKMGLGCLQRGVAFACRTGKCTGLKLGLEEKETMFPLLFLFCIIQMFQFFMFRESFFLINF